MPASRRKTLAAWTPNQLNELRQTVEAGANAGAAPKLEVRTPRPLRRTDSLRRRGPLPTDDLPARGPGGRPTRPPAADDALTRVFLKVRAARGRPKPKRPEGPHAVD